MTPAAVWDEISMSALALEIGVSKTAVYKWKRSRIGIPHWRVREVAALTGLAPDALRPDLYHLATLSPKTVNWDMSVDVV
tara:strand:- start:281 stop:520 length:240 start_codon:yes stop_codon:yes gene_type:complete